MNKIFIFVGVMQFIAAYANYMANNTAALVLFILAGVLFIIASLIP